MSRLTKTKRRIWTVENNQMRRKTDFLATEEPLEIQLRAGAEQRTLAITMRTPGNDYELAAGFLYNESIVQEKHDIGQMIYCVDGQQERQEYNVLRVNLNRTHLPDLHQLDRHFFTNSACGVCGQTMLEDLNTQALPPLAEHITTTSAVLASLPDTLRSDQDLFATTGGLHAAALFSTLGELIVLREDVGRHNALDKLVGWGLLHKQLPFRDKLIMVSGRASYELLQKCRVAGVSIFCAVSAPSSLAVELAEQFGITLVGFLRGERFNIYTNPHRIVLPESASLPAQPETQPTD